MRSLCYEFLKEPSPTYWRLATRPLQTLWMHPEIEGRLNPAFGPKVFREAVEEGFLWPSERAPWHFLAPVLQDRLLGRLPSRRALQILKAGPSAHERFIFRSVLSCRHFLGAAHIHVDEGIFSESLPGAWGSQPAVHPDILIAPAISWWPRIWIECERHLKRPQYYQRKIEKIPRGDLLVYVLSCDAKLRQFRSCLDRVLTRPRPRHLFSLVESEAASFFRRLHFRFQVSTGVVAQTCFGDGAASNVAILKSV